MDPLHMCGARSKGLAYVYVCSVRFLCTKNSICNTFHWQAPSSVAGCRGHTPDGAPVYGFHEAAVGAGRGAHHDDAHVKKARERPGAGGLVHGVVVGDAGDERAMDHLLLQAHERRLAGLGGLPPRPRPRGRAGRPVADLAFADHHIELLGGVGALQQLDPVVVDVLVLLGGAVATWWLEGGGGNGIDLYGGNGYHKRGIRILEDPEGAADAHLLLGKKRLGHKLPVANDHLRGQGPEGAATFLDFDHVAGVWGGREHG